MIVRFYLLAHFWRALPLSFVTLSHCCCLSLTSPIVNVLAPSLPFILSSVFSNRYPFVLGLAYKPSTLFISFILITTACIRSLPFSPAVSIQLTSMASIRGLVETATPALEAGPFPVWGSTCITLTPGHIFRIGSLALILVSLRTITSGLSLYNSSTLSLV